MNAVTRHVISAKHFALHLGDTKCQENFEYLAEYLSLIGSNLRFHSIPDFFSVRKVSHFYCQHFTIVGSSDKDKKIYVQGLLEGILCIDVRLYHLL